MARVKKIKGASAERAGQADPSAPLDGGELLAAARPVLALLRDDLGRRAEDVRVERALRARYEAEKAAHRTADSFAEWRDGLLVQVAASWFLSCVFVRTLEDRGLLGQARLAGPGATDSQTLFFQLAPSLTERDYLLFVFRELAELPAARALFDREHAMVWQLAPSADAAKELLRLFRTPSAEEPAFRFGQASTRFLGDLYQDLYEDVRKRYALLQTPDFIESFILDRTLEPAIERFGLDDTTLIDPTCGSGHFLLGAFDRLFEHRLRTKPGIDVAQAAHQALGAVFGADINPYAVAIARVRLTLSYLEKAEVRRLKDAPALPLHLVVADSLLYNPQHAQLGFEHREGQSTEGWRAEAFQLEDPDAARDVLHRRYAAVVGNPPYITEKDSAKRETYRAMYPRSAAGKYSLAAPFCERFFQLARDRGPVGQITANSFMKREFGKKLIEEYLTTVNLEVIVNTSGALIPGHGTPTVLLFGTHESPVNRAVLTVLAKRGEPSTPADPAKGKVWSSIAAHWCSLGFDNDYITVANMDRDKLGSHPWSLGGGGAVELKELIEERAQDRLDDLTDSIGISSFTLEDDVFIRPQHAWARSQCPSSRLRTMIVGEAIRDWSVSECDTVFFPYDDFRPMDSREPALRLLWPWQKVLSNSKLFGNKTKVESGLAWYEYGRLTADKLKTPLAITFAFVATHNHFVLERGGKIFNRTAPIIKLPAASTEEDHLALLAYLNSSTAAFFFRQAGHSKGAQGVNEGHKSEEWEQFLEYSGALVASLPVPSGLTKLAPLARDLSSGAAALRASSLAGDESTSRNLLARLVALQENLDWEVYAIFGLIPERNIKQILDVPFDSLAPGVRPFEVLLARAASTEGGQRTAWFDRNGYLQPRVELSSPALDARLAAIEQSSELRLLEAPTFKHRWTVPDCSALSMQASRDAALAAAERAFTTFEIRTFRALAAMDDRSAFDEQAVPYLAALRYTDTGLAKQGLWLTVWEAQRREEAGAPPSSQVAPKYSSGDYASTAIWQLRGKLDVPKERFISYPGCESDEDGEPVYGWAGWDHVQRAQALASLYQKRKIDEGWTTERLKPMLAGLLELLPWIKQWHNEPDAEFDGQKMGDYFEQFLEGECLARGLTHADLEAWRPTRGTKKSAKPAPVEDTPEAVESEPPKRLRKKGKA